MNTLWAAIAIALAAWGWGGVRMDVDYESLPNGTLGYAYIDSDLSQCTMRLTEGLRSSVDLEFLSDVVTHELGHCLGLRHDPNCHSIMYFFYAACWPQSITIENRVEVKSFRDIFLRNRVFVPNLAR